MSLLELTQQALAENGALAKAIEGYVPRPAQQRLSDIIAETIDSKGELILRQALAREKRMPIWCRPCCLASARLSQREHAPCRISFTCVICRAFALHWGCG